MDIKYSVKVLAYISSWRMSQLDHQIFIFEDTCLKLSLWMDLKIGVLDFHNMVSQRWIIWIINWRRGLNLPNIYETHIRNAYLSHIYVAEELGTVDTTYYQSFIDILICMVEIVLIYICLETSMISSHLAFPR